MYVIHFLRVDDFEDLFSPEWQAALLKWRYKIFGFVFYGPVDCRAEVFKNRVFGFEKELYTDITNMVQNVGGSGSSFCNGRNLAIIVKKLKRAGETSPLQLS